MNPLQKWEDWLDIEYSLNEKIYPSENKYFEERLYTIVTLDKKKQVLIVGSIQVVFDFRDRELYILDVTTHKKFRGMGIATFLLRYVASKANMLKPPLKYIKLDDMSLFARYKKKNIYLKVGMKPETTLREPERKGLIVDIQSNAGWRNFFKKYLHKNNIVFIQK